MRKDGLGVGRHQIRSHIFVADVSDGFDDIVAMFRAPEHSIPVLSFPVVGFFGMINLKNRVSTDFHLRMNIIFPETRRAYRSGDGKVVVLIIGRSVPDSRHLVYWPPPSP